MTAPDASGLAEIRARQLSHNAITDFPSLASYAKQLEADRGILLAHTDAQAARIAVLEGLAREGADVALYPAGNEEDDDLLRCCGCHAVIGAHRDFDPMDHTPDCLVTRLRAAGGMEGKDGN